MDIISHGLWGGIAVGRESKRSYWVAFAFGIFPDLLSFGFVFFNFLTIAILLGEPLQRPHPGQGYENIPDYVFSLYNITHSLVIFLFVFMLVWLIRRKPLWEMSAWAIHVSLDIFTHNSGFFPTPFLWPLSSYYFEGINWGTPGIFIPNVLFLFAAYLWWYFERRKEKGDKDKNDHGVHKPVENVGKQNSAP